VQKSSLALSQIFEPIRADLELVDREFARHVESQVELIPQIGRYIQTSGGKRIRPAVSRIVGGDRCSVVRAGLGAVRALTAQEERPDEGDALQVGPDELVDERALAAGLCVEAGTTAGAKSSVMGPSHTHSTPARPPSYRRQGRKSADMRTEIGGGCAHPAPAADGNVRRMERKPAG